MQSLAEAGEVPVQAAETVATLAEQGADAADLLQALKTAAEQGQMPAEALRFVVSALEQGGEITPALESPPPQAPGPAAENAWPLRENIAEAINTLEALAESGEIPPDVAGGILELLDKGDIEAVYKALKTGAGKGLVSARAAQQIITALQGTNAAESAGTDGAKKPRK